MKNSIIILVFLLITTFSFTSRAQTFSNYYSKKYDSFNPSLKGSIELAVETTRSIRGWSHSWSVGINLSDRFKTSYYNSINIQRPEVSQSAEKGLEMSYLIKAKGRFNVGVVLRNSVIDNRFVAFVPMVQSKLWLSDRLSIKSNVGMSDRYPIFNSSIQFRLN